MRSGCTIGFSRLLVVTAALAPLLAGCAARPAQAPLSVHYDLAEIEKSVGYAMAVKSGEYLFVSGTIGQGDTLEAQLVSAYQRIEAALRKHDIGFEAVVRETIFTTDFDALIAAQAARKRFYAGHTPAASWVGVTRLYLPGAKVEIEVTARLPR
jgi:enamine deaminase RidA (YjgF/YER057c/UK114 family)